MTREELLIQKIEWISRYRDSDGEMVFGERIGKLLPEILERLRTPAPLQKWTPEMGTPPDGLYISEFGPCVNAIWIADGMYSCGVRHGHARNVYAHESRQLYGPIPAPEGGERE